MSLNDQFFLENIAWAVEKAEQKNMILWQCLMVNDRVCLDCMISCYPTFKATFIARSTRHFTNIYVCGNCGKIHDPKQGYNYHMKGSSKMVQFEWLQAQKEDSISWAKEVIADNQTLFLDTETTGLNDAEICEIAIIDSWGEVAYYSYVKPKNGIPIEAEKIHGISNEMVKDAPSWEQVAPLVKKCIAGHRVIIYNAIFDRKMMHQSDQQAGLHRTEWKEIAKFQCAMEEFARFYGEYNDYHGSFRWQKLGYAYYHITRKNLHEAHGAVVDAMACREVVIGMSLNLKPHPF